jgi:hypothetical protein
MLGKAIQRWMAQGLAMQGKATQRWVAQDRAIQDRAWSPTTTPPAAPDRRSRYADREPAVVVLPGPPKLPAALRQAHPPVTRRRLSARLPPERQGRWCLPREG